MISNTVAIFVPLIITIVIQLSAVARDIDLSTETGAIVDLPGRFVILHAANIAIITIAIGIVQSSEGSQSIMAELVLITVLAVLPLIEIDEYDKKGVFQPSLGLHWLFTVTVFAISLYWTQIIFDFTGLLIGFQLVSAYVATAASQVIIRSLVLLLSSIIVIAFLWQLVQELSST